MDLAKDAAEHQDSFTNLAPSNKGRLMGAFGKACAIAAVAATIAVYVGGAQIGMDVYRNYQDMQGTQTVATQVLETRPGHMTWGQEGAAFVLSLSAGFGAIALGKKRQKVEESYSNSSGYYYGNSYAYNNSNSGFWDGYFMGSIFNGSGSSSSSSSSSGSNNNAGAAILAVVAVAGITAAAASAAVVSYKAVRMNFGNTHKIKL